MGDWLCQKQMDKEQWISLGIFHVHHRSVGLGVKSSCAWLCDESSCGARTQNILAVGWLVLSMLCVGSHTVLESLVEGNPHAHGTDLSPISFRLPLQ